MQLWFVGRRVGLHESGGSMAGACQQLRSGILLGVLCFSLLVVVVTFPDELAEKLHVGLLLCMLCCVGFLIFVAKCRSCTTVENICNDANKNECG